jgi:hypothetical protein
MVKNIKTKIKGNCENRNIKNINGIKTNWMFYLKLVRCCAWSRSNFN